MINTNSLGEMITHCIKAHTSWRRRATEAPSSVTEHKQRHLHRAYLLLETDYDEMSGWEHTNTIQELFPKPGKIFAPENFFPAHRLKTKESSLCL